jgi:undecaprenyl-diphosphatase
VATPGSPSFPSGHTATAFAAAAVVGAIYPRLRWPLYSVAALVGLSRIYLGVHFALDVAAGAILGLSIGLGLVWAGRKTRSLRT